MRNTIGKTITDKAVISTSIDHGVAAYFGTGTYHTVLEIYAPKEMMLDGIINRLQHSSESLIMKNQNRLDLVKNSNVFKNPQEIIKNQKENYLLQLSKLEILNPLNTLKRGYTLAKSDGKLISSAKQLKSGDNLEVEFEDGNVNTKVI